MLTFDFAQIGTQRELLVNVQMLVKASHLPELERFSKGEGKVQDAHSILTDMIQHVYEAEPLPTLVSRGYEWAMENATVVCLVRDEKLIFAFL